MTKLDIPEAQDRRDVQEAVRAEQVRLIYRNAPTGIAINLINSIIVAIIMAGQVSRSLMVTWLFVVVLVALVRVEIVRRYRCSRSFADNVARWGVLFSVGAGLAGATWGIWGLFTTLYVDLPYQVFVAFVVGGMALGALAVSGAFIPAYLAFLLPAVIPMELGWLLQADRTAAGMAALGLAFLIALYVLGRHLNQGVSKSIRLSLERASLIRTLRNANDELTQTTQRLAEEGRERQRAEAEVRESEATYRAMFEKNEAVKLLIDPVTGRIVDANPASSAFYGYPLDELKKKRITDINMLEAKEVHKHMSRASAEKQGRFEFHHRLASGEIRDVEVNSAPIELRGKKLLFSIIHDITTRKRAEEALRKARDVLEVRVRERTDELMRTNEQLRREILDRKRAEALLLEEKERAEVTLHSIGDAVITTNADGVVEYMNPAAEATTGWALDQARGLLIEDVFEVIDEQNRTRVPNLVAQCLNEDRTVGSPDHSVLLSQSGKEYAIQYSAAPIRTRDGTFVGAVLVFADVTEARRMAKQIAHQAAHDALTGLVNRREFEVRLDHALRSVKQSGNKHVLCYLDLDRFKFVNDTVGHVAGDELLKQVADLLRSKIRDRDTLARVGGDEFGLLLENCTIAKAAEIAQSLVAAFRDYRFTWAGRNFEIGASIGLAPISAQNENTVQILSQADLACYMAKEEGRNRARVYRQIGDTPDGLHLDFPQAAELRSALHDGRFHLYCQPIVPLSSEHGHPAYYELLLRMKDKGEGVQLPNTFLPAAERYGLLANIDRWVIRTSCIRYAESFGRDLTTGMSINLSGDSLNDESLVGFVLQQFEEGAVPPEQVCFEITETAAISNLAHTTHIITTLKDLGCRFALDDFGRGLSSLSYLKQLPVDYVKIDGSFIREMAENRTDYAMVEAVNKLSHTIGIKTIAEYVESACVIDSLRNLGVDYGQGSAIGSPTPLESISAPVSTAY
ncbi:MAG: EAL domain-containing protein [Gammaproteobacteria bacterium]|nr:EAL domain-containing protein [Gammaproteobacteria bacterium]